MKRSVKFLIVFCCVASIYTTGFAQYYGEGYRRNPGPPPPQPKEKEDNGGYTQPSGYLSVNFGFATPEANFAQAFGSNYGGYAQPGSVFHFSLGIPIQHSNFGIALMYGNYNNGYDLNTFCNNNGFIPAPADNEYSEQAIMGGLFFTYPIGRLSLDGRAMIGALLCSFPEQDYYAEDAASNEYQLDLQSSNSTGLAYDVGVGVRYLIVKLGRRPLCAMVNVDYLYSTPSYNTQQIEYETPAANNPNGITYQLVPNLTYSGHLPIQLLNVTFGLGYQLGE